MTEGIAFAAFLSGVMTSVINKRGPCTKRTLAPSPNLADAMTDYDRVT